MARAADRCQALPEKNLLLMTLPRARVPTRTCGLAPRWVGQKRQWSGQQRMPRRRRPVLPPQTRRGKQHEAMRCLKRRITAWDGIHSLAGYVPTRQVSPKLRDLEHVNLHDDLGKCRRQRSHVLTTRHRPERRPSRPVKIIDTQRGTRSALAPGPSVYVLTPISGVFPGHCPFSADTPT